MPSQEHVHSAFRETCHRDLGTTHQLSAGVCLRQIKRVMRHNYFYQVVIQVAQLLLDTGNLPWVHSPPFDGQTARRIQTDNGDLCVRIERLEFLRYIASVIVECSDETRVQMHRD